jgi:tetratricopeptide (TPR) repeat protein
MLRVRFPVFVAAACLLAVACGKDPETAKREFLQSGNGYFEAGRYAEAIVEYQNAIQLDSNFADARLRLAEAYEKTRDGARALREFVRAADLLPDDSEVQLKAGQFLAASGRFEDAKSRAQAVLQREPRNVEAQILYANSLAGLKDLDGAITEIEQAAELDPSQGRVQANLGLLQLAKGNREQAEAAFRKAVAIDPGSVDARLALAGFLWSVGDVAGVEGELKGVLKAQPRHSTANRTLATLYVLTNRVVEAEPFFKRLTEDAADERPWIALADYYVIRGKTDEAIAILARLAADERTFAVGKTKLAMLAYDERRTADARQFLREVLDKDPKSAPALLMRARLSIAESKWDEALADIQATIAVEPQAIGAHYLLGVVQAEKGKLEDATAAFNETLRLNPRASAAYFQLARVHLARRNTDDAIKAARQALDARPSFAPARLVLVDSLIAKADLAQAERELRALPPQVSRSADVLVRAARIAAGRGQMEVARTSFSRALDADPKSIDALSGLAAADIAANRTADARARVEARLTQSPRDGRLLMTAATVYIADKDFKKAEEMLRRAIEVDPSSLVAYNTLGQLYVIENRLDEALASFEQLDKAHGSTATASLVAMILQAQNKTDEAVKRFEAILERDPNAVMAANNLAWIYAERGQNLDRALQLARRASELRPDEPQIRDTIGWVYYKQQLPLLAVPEFERSVKLEPRNPMFQYHLGLAHIAGGEPAKGRSALERALKLQPNHPGATEALAAAR